MTLSLNALLIFSLLASPITDDPTQKAPQDGDVKGGSVEKSSAAAPDKNDDGGRTLPKATYLEDDVEFFTAADSGEKQGESYLLRYQFKDGEQLRYQTTQTMTQEAVGENQRKIDISTVMQKRRFQVTDVRKNGDASATMQFEKVHMELKSGDLDPIVFDSSMTLKEVPRLYQAAARKLRGVAPEFELSAAGIKLDKEGVEIAPEKGRACFMVLLPQNEVRIGDTWKSTLEVEVRLTTKVNRTIRLLRTHRLTKVEDGIAHITVSTSVMSPVVSVQVKSQLLQATPQGTIQFDIARGRVVRRELNFDKSVLGAFGAGTMLSAKGKTVEELLPPAKVAKSDRNEGISSSRLSD